MNINESSGIHEVDITGGGGRSWNWGDRGFLNQKWFHLGGSNHDHETETEFSSQHLIVNSKI